MLKRLRASREALQSAHTTPPPAGQQGPAALLLQVRPGRDFRDISLSSTHLHLHGLAMLVCDGNLQVVRPVKSLQVRKSKAAACGWQTHLARQGRWGRAVGVEFLADASRLGLAASPRRKMWQGLALSHARSFLPDSSATSTCRKPCGDTAPHGLRHVDIALESGSQLLACDKAKPCHICHTHSDRTT